MGIVYKITNIINGKVYIGKTRRSIEHRWREHCKDAERGLMQKLYKAIRIFGKESFTIEILFQINCLKHVNFLEQKYIKKLKTRDFKFGYNGIGGGGGGAIISVETQIKMSLAHKGVKLSEAHKQKIGQSLKGRPVSEETRNKIADGNRGRIQSESTKTRIGMSKLGSIHSEETKLKMSISAKKHPSNKKKGVPWSEKERLSHTLSNLKRKRKSCASQI